VAVDALGQLLGEVEFAATATGYAQLRQWAERQDDLGELVFGIEGAGSWGAGLCQALQRAGHHVVEVERPRRAERRVGKTDRIDALAAAKCVLAGEKVSTPRRHGTLRALRALLNVRRSTIAQRTRLLNQLQALNVTAPVTLPERVGDGTGKQLERRLLSMRSQPSADIEERAVFGVMRDLAARSRALARDAQRYERDLAEISERAKAAASTPRRWTQPFVFGRPALMKRWRAPSCSTAWPNSRARNSEPLSVVTSPSFQPAYLSSLATRRTSSRVWRALGLRSEVPSSAQA
jgi:transposase